MLKNVLRESLNNPNTESVKVFVLPFDAKDKRARKPEADGKVRYNKDILLKNKKLFEDWFSGMDGAWTAQDFMALTATPWTDNVDDANLLMGALQILGFGKVVGNDEQAELLKARGFDGFPVFKFGE